MACFTSDRDEDTMKYLKEKLKLDVLRFNNGEITELILLAIYYELLVFQARTKNFKNGLKTLKSLKLYNINSMDVCDVIKVMESRDYKKYFPLSLLHRDFDITEECVFTKPCLFADTGCSNIKCIHKVILLLE